MPRHALAGALTGFRPIIVTALDGSSHRSVRGKLKRAFAAAVAAVTAGLSMWLTATTAGDSRGLRSSPRGAHAAGPLPRHAGTSSSAARLPPDPRVPPAPARG